MVRDLWPAWDPASRTTPWLSCGVARQRCRPSGHPRAFRIGNAAAAVDPIGGEGIGLALWSAANLAGMLRRSIRTTADARTLRRIQRQADAALARRLCLRRPACRIAAEALMRPRLIAALWPLLTLRRLTLAPWYAATGKPWLLPGVARTPGLNSPRALPASPTRIPPGSAPMPVIAAANLCLAHGVDVILDGCTFTLEQGASGSSGATAPARPRS